MMLFLINYNADALAKAFNRFIDDVSLYSRCKANTKASVERFSIENISKDWVELLK